MSHYNGTGVNRLYQGGKEQPLMFDINSTHPIIPNSQDYTIYKKYVSIHSEDRDILKYPQSSLFEIELPQDYLNVYTVRLSNWTFPSNYNTFSVLNSNVTMTFKINNPYNPGENGNSDPLQNAIFDALYTNSDNNYSIQISDGFYTPDQVATELTNRFNQAVSVFIKNYLSIHYPTLVSSFILYQDFVIVYNNVKQNIWFGNQSSGFLLTNETSVLKDVVGDSVRCGRTQLPDFSSWGLPAYVGLSRVNMNSQPSLTPPQVRFYYGDVFPGDAGFWLLPNITLPGAQAYYIESLFKINVMGPSHMYMEIGGLDCIDETSPYNLSEFTQTTNKTNGVVNSAFCKIPVPTTPLSQWFDKEAPTYKLFLPPAERIRKLKVKIRYHDGQLVNFGTFNYTFTLEFVLFSSQPAVGYQLTMSKFI